MTIDQITSFVSISESEETPEVKETTEARHEAAMMVCVFLNQHGSQVLKQPFKALLHKLVTEEMRMWKLDLFDLVGGIHHGQTS